MSGPSAGRQSAALFFLRIRPGAERLIYAPERHRDMVEDAVEICDFRARLADVPIGSDFPASSRLQMEIRPGDNVAVLTVNQVGGDLTARVNAERSHVFSEGIDALYVDLPLDLPETALVSESLEDLKLSYSGIFPNSQAAGDVLRLQCLRRATALSHDVIVASPHGSALLDYVLADMASVGQPVVRLHDHPAEGRTPTTMIPLVTSPLH